MSLLVLVLVASVRADDDPLVNGVKLSELKKQFNEAKSEDAKSNIIQNFAEAKDLPKPGVEFLRTALKDKAFIVRLNVAMALAQIGPKASPAVPDLIATLKDERPEVRAAAATALGQIGPDAKDAVAPLGELLKDKTQPPTLRQAAALALGKTKSKDSVALLKATAAETDGLPRVSAAWALYLLDRANAKEAIPVLRSALKDKNVAVQTSAVQTLGYIGPDAKGALDDLKAVAKTGGMAAYYAQDAIKKIDKR
jgi:HEAT repeat protein